MIYKNGYKVVYEVAADGKRTFYATKSNAYPAEGDIELASFTDADFTGKTIYEYKGEFYVSTGALPAYNEDGTPKDSKITGFDVLFTEQPAESAQVVNDIDPVEPDAPVVTDETGDETGDETDLDEGNE